MALTYHLYCPLEPEEVERRLDAFRRKADTTRSWVLARASAPESLRRERRAEEGFPGPFASYAYVRLFKADPMAGRALVKRFLVTLPEPKVAPFEGEPLKDQTSSAGTIRKQPGQGAGEASVRPDNGVGRPWWRSRTNSAAL